MHLHPAEVLVESLQSVLQQRGLGDAQITVEHPAVLDHGDYATNVALGFWQAAGAKNPRQFAEELIAILQKEPTLSQLFDRISVAGPGFINFSLKKAWLLNVPAEIVAADADYGRGTHQQHHTILVEFTDANPFKEFHIGHLMSNAVGEALSRLLEFQSADVKRLCYQGDVGVHIAKALWGWQAAVASKQINEAELVALPLAERVNWLGKFYAAGAKAFEAEPASADEIKKINAAIYTSSDPVITQRYQAGRQWSLDYLETIYAVLGTKFEHYYFESQTGVTGTAIVKEWLKKGIFEESQGAVIFPGEKHGLHTRVFINSLGLPTYEAKELGLAETKRRDYQFDTSIVVTGNEIQDYFKVLLKAMSLIMPEAAAKTRHVPHGMLRLTTGKMSSRTGNIITGKSLLDDLTAATLTKVQEAGRVKVAANQQAKVASDIAVAAMKFTILRQSIGRDIIFNPDEAISFEGDTGPYIQYTYARAKSILAKPTQSPTPDGLPSTELSPEAWTLLRYVYRFPEVAARAAADLSPSDVCAYLLKLAQAFNSFYGAEQIHGNSNETFLRQLTQATAVVLKNGLHICGIRVVEQM